MARGPSGRLVIEVDPNLKRDLHAALAADGVTLKNWFLQRAADYIAEYRQPSLPGITSFSATDEEPSLRAAEDPAIYRTSTTRLNRQQRTK
jgi:hypothetical protein